MFDALTLTDYLALMIGLYLLAAGAGLLFEGANYKAMLVEFKDNVALGYITAIMTFVIGVVLVKLHTDWSGWRAGLVSLFGWAALIEGVLMLAVREKFLSFFTRFDFSAALVRGFGIGCLVLGALLVGSALV